MKIFINPGHCVGVDPGAVGNGLIEAEVAAKIGGLAAAYLRAVGYAVKVFQYDGLRAIAEDANAWGADLFVSIHCNAAANDEAKGTETFYWNGGEGKDLARCINKQIAASVKVVNRGIKTANFAVLAYTDMPAVLVETAFITNFDDACRLRDDTDEFGRAIARGVTDYLKLRLPIPDVIDAPADKGRFSEHFDASEFACNHCGAGADKIHGRLIDYLEQLRSACGDRPLHINSGYRCPIHNRNVGGVADSQHVKGTAADVATPADMSFESFARAVESVAFDGIGYYPPIGGSGSFIHVDVRNGGVDAGIRWEG